MDWVTQRLWRGVEGPRRRLITPAARSFSTTGPDNGISCDGWSNIFVAFKVEQALAAKTVPALRWLKTQNGMGTLSSDEALRLRATSAVSPIHL
jgi:hypothetical protein